MKYRRRPVQTCFKIGNSMNTDESYLGSSINWIDLSGKVYKTPTNARRLINRICMLYVRVVFNFIGFQLNCEIISYGERDEQTSGAKQQINHVLVTDDRPSCIEGNLIQLASLVTGIVCGWHQNSLIWSLNRRAAYCRRIVEVLPESLYSSDKGRLCKRRSTHSDNLFSIHFIPPVWCLKASCIYSVLIEDEL